MHAMKRLYGLCPRLLVILVICVSRLAFALRYNGNSLALPRHPFAGVGYYSKTSSSPSLSSSLLHSSALDVDATLKTPDRDRDRYSSTHNPPSAMEYNIRRAIIQKDMQEAKRLVSEIDASHFDSGRTAVYVIAETCRKNRFFNAILPLFKSIPKGFLEECSVDDIIPLINDFGSKKNMLQVQPVIDYCVSKGIPLSLKAYSIIISGYGRQKNELMIDTILDHYNKNAAVRAELRADVVRLSLSNLLLLPV